MTDITIGTAGHIDHGKTALVRALTGINTDRLSEEKQRGITIDIGFAHMNLGSFRVGFVDVPGHERFVKNMLSGIGGIRLLLLVIAADESIMPQTVEHLQICNLLGIPGGIIVITRTSLAEKEIVELVKEEALDTCRGTFLENAPVVCVDSISGEGIEELKSEISRQITRLASEDLSLEFRSRQITRLPIDRVFSLKGFGTIVTGTLLSGLLNQDDTVSPYPADKDSDVYKVRSIEVFNEKEKTATTGQRTAVNLAGASVEKLRRGMILSVPGKMEAAFNIDAVVNIHPESPSSLQHRMPVRLHHGSGECIARTYLLENNIINPGEKGLVQFRLDTSILGFPGDRFILRRYSPATTIGGGIILHNKPPRHRRKNLDTLRPRLEALSGALAQPEEKNLEVLLPYLLEEKDAAGTTLRELAARTGATEKTLLEYLKKLSSSITHTEDHLHFAWKDSLAGKASQILEFIESFHSENPLSQGVSRQEVYERFLPELAPPLFQKLLSEMGGEKKIKTSGSVISAFRFSPEMDGGQQAIRTEIMSLFLDAFPGKESPGIKTVISLPGLGKQGRDVFYHMLNSGELVRINEDFLATPQQIENVIETARTAFPPSTPFQVPDFKNLFDLSRKHAIPLLEHLDRIGITKRSGNDRTITEKEI